MPEALTVTHAKKRSQCSGRRGLAVTHCLQQILQHLKEPPLTPGIQDGNDVYFPFLIHSRMQKLYDLFIFCLAKYKEKKLNQICNQEK